MRGHARIQLPCSPVFEPLEDRCLLSVAPLNVVLVSDAVAQAQQVRAAAAKDTIAIVYHSDTMTTTGLVDLLASVSAAHNGAPIGHLAIVAHGGPGEVHLGNGDDLSLATLPGQVASLERLQSALTNDARLDLYSCSVAAGAAGKTFVDALAAATGAAVFASDNPVGTVPGSDFVWEYHTGQAAANNELLSLQELDTVSRLCLLTLNANQVAQYAYVAGFRGGSLVDAIAVANAESGFVVEAAGDGGNSLGLWQINLPSHPTYDAYSLQHDPAYNAAKAREIYVNSACYYGNDQGWRPWTTFMYESFSSPYMTGAWDFTHFLDGARDAAETVDSTVICGVNDRVLCLSNGVHVRPTPGGGGTDTPTVNAGATGTVLADAQVVATVGGDTYRYIWWHIHWDGGLGDGWVAENFLSRTGTAATTDYPGATWVAGVPSGNYTAASRSASDIRWIVIHTTESTADSAIQWFQNPASLVSANYLVKRDGSIVQLIRDHDIAWHAGNWSYNQESIGIEHERYAGAEVTPAQYAASAQLTQWLATQYDANIVFPTGIAPADPAAAVGVIGHNQVPDPSNPSLGGGANHHTDPTNWDWNYYESLLGVDATPPTVGVFEVAPTTTLFGGYFNIHYIVTDTGGSGLNRVELWRTDDTDASGNPIWHNDDEVKRTLISGNGPVSDVFTDSPSSVGSYWYGIHVVDNAGNWNDEQNSRTGNQPGDFGPIQVMVVSQLPQVVIDDPSVTEGDAGTRNLRFTVSLSGTPLQFVGVHYATSDGTASTTSDYLEQHGDLQCAPGETNATWLINVPVIGDYVIEDDETITVTLSNPSNVVIADGQAIGTILNDDAAGSIQFGSVTYTVNENGGSASIYVTRMGGLGAGAGANYATSNGSASAGSDYTGTSGQLTFGGGQTSKTFTVPIINDTQTDPNETVNLALSTPTGGAVLGVPSTATLTIWDDDGLGPVDLVWQAKAPIPRPLGGSAVAVYDNKIHVIGGSYLLAHYCFDPSSNAWAPLAEVPLCGIDEGGAGAIGTRIYAVHNEFEDSVKIYDVASNTWTTGVPMLTCRRYPAVAAVGGRLYAIGGFDASLSPSTAVEVYDPIADAWFSRTAMPTARGVAAAAVLENLIYVMGGRDGGTVSKKVEVYDPTADSWSARASMLTRRSGAAVAVVGGKIYLIGGFDGMKALNTVDEYDPATDAWRTVAMPLSTARSGAVAGVVNGKIYVTGGFDCNSTELSSTEEGTLVVQPKPAEITVLYGSIVVLDGQAAPVDIGSARQGVSGPSKVFTIRNDGEQPLTLTGPFADLPHFIVGDPGKTTLAHNETTTFTVTLKTDAAWSGSEEVSFGNNDGDNGDGVENPFNLTITGEVLPWGPTITAVRLNGNSGRGVSAVEPSGAGVQTIEISFDKIVTWGSGAAVLLRVSFSGGTEQVGPTLSPLSITGTDTNKMTITFASGSVVNTWVKVTLSSAGIADLSGNALDGEVRAGGSGRGYLYNAAVDLPTGDGLPGGDAVFYVGSLRGDFSGDLAITAADKDGFAAAWRSGSLDADFRGVGFGPRPPDGRITLADINGFTSVYQAGIALGRHLEPLPMSGGGLASEVTPLPPLTAPSAGTDILTEAAGLLPLSQQTAPPVTGPQDTHRVQGDEEPLDLLRLRRLRPVAVIQSAGAVVLRV
ncbi:MAG: DUF4347 domain-containing protein [Planctomycetota bacterium]|nr:DUF4347 domain-containing protein [Planctomycetota bacterium]